MEGYRGALPIPDLQEYGLGRSFRTAAPVLEFVDAAIHAIGPETFGLDHVPTPHEGQDRPGLVTLWPVIGAVDEDAADDAGEAEEAGWIARPDRVLAETIARQVSNWMKDGFPLVKGGSRLAGPGDVMVLVRRRRDLAGLIVARLYAHGVPVAGVDRLRVGDPLAVQDLMAALRFAAQPLDDLSLACLLVSPIMGWTQDDLMLHAMRPEKMGLWKHLRESSDPMVMETVQRLRDLLNRADYEAPHAMLHWMLTGPWAARRALVARLGEEANDPINELLNAAFAFSSAHVASLQGFIRWFDAGDGELKREADGGGGQVRVMTVHGSKGLQAPIVILADAAGRPGSGPSSAIDLPIDPLGEDVSRRAPIPALPQDQQRGAIAAEYETVRAAEMEEHWRLLYVAMTRAEEALFIGGSLGLKEKAPHEDSWYARLAPLFDGDGVEDALWQGTRFEWGEAPAMEAGMAPASNDNAASPRAPLPDWAMRPIGPEPRPPRPLAPSGAGEDLAPDPPIRAGGDPLAAQRGTLIHALLERLPNVAPDQRASTARAWLERRGQDFDDAALDEMVASALAVMDDARFARVFAPGSLAEVPLSATVGGTVIAGTADRLVVNPDEVMVVDYKTTRRPPASASEIPAATLAQMAAYVAALRTIYPGRRVTAGLLYTHAPALFALDEDALAPAIDRLRMR
jgi:ATP-dependent helicase/nuclease subunit A